MKWGILFLLLSSPVFAESTKTTFNPFTGKLDYITKLDSATLPSGSTQYIQSSETLQSGATFYVSSGTVGTGGLYVVSGSSIVSAGASDGLYFYTPNNNNWKFTGKTADIGRQSITFTPTTITMSDIIFGLPPTFTLNMGGNSILSLASNTLCSDLSSTCLASPFSFNGSPGNIATVNIDNTGKIATGAKHKTAKLVIGGSALIGTGYSDTGAMPSDGLRVMGEIIASSSTISGPSGLAVTYGAVLGSVTASNLSSGQCVQTTTGGLLTTTGAACGSGGAGGGASTLAVTTGTAAGFVGPPISSPTAVVNFNSSQFVGALTDGGTAYIGLNTSSVTLLGPDLSLSYLTTSSATATYLQTSSATATYLQNSSATATYLQTSSATATYLQNSSATATYLAQSSASVTYLQNSSATATYLQSSSATATYLNINQGLTQSSATATYLQLTSATATYLQGSSATATYLQLSSATATYLNKNQATNGTVTSVSGTSPLNSSGGNTPAISLSQTIGQPETFTSSVTISAILGSSTTFGAYAGSVTVNNLTASLPVQTDANKQLASAAIDLSGTQATGVLAAARFPALTGDVTNSAGSLATTLNSIIGTTVTWTGSNTYSNSKSTQTYNGLLTAVMVDVFPHTIDSAGALEAANVFVSEIATVDPGVSLEGVYAEAVGSITTGSMSKPITGFNAVGYITATDSATYTASIVPGELRGGTMAVIYAGSGTITTGTGLTAFTQKKPSSHGVTTNLYAVDGWNIQQSASAGVANQGVFFAKQPIGTVGGNVTNQYGLYIEKQASGANPATSHFGIYQADSGDQNIFMGTSTFSQVSISTLTVPSLLLGLASISNNYTAASTATVILADSTGVSLTVTLPTAVGITGRVYSIKRLNSGANTVTIATTGGQTIDGGSTAVISIQYTSLDIISDGSNWQIL